MKCLNCGYLMNKKEIKLKDNYFETLNNQKLTMYFCNRCGESFFNIKEFDKLIKTNIDNLIKEDEYISKEQILEIRNKYNLTKKEMSLILGRPVSYISQLENGEKILSGTIKDIYTYYFFQGKILEFVEKYKNDIPKDYYENIVSKVVSTNRRVII